MLLPHLLFSDVQLFQRGLQDFECLPERTRLLRGGGERVRLLLERRDVVSPGFGRHRLSPFS
jgi:hypothetical protein